MAIPGRPNAMHLAEKLGWLNRPGMLGQPQANVAPIGPMEDVSAYAMQDMLAILGFYRGPKDGVWSQDLQDALFKWAGARWGLAVIPKEEGQTIAISPQEAWLALTEEARTRLGRPQLPIWFWPALAIGGGIAALALVIYLFRRQPPRTE